MQVILNDKFFGKYRDIIRTEMIPYQWKVLNDEIAIKIERERNDNSIPNEKSHAIENLKIAAGISEGDHYGWVFQDSDVYKWLEAVAYSLKDKMDDDLKSIADDVVSLIGQAQEEDGYLSTYYTIKEPDRKFKNLGEGHELYCAGHFLEAAVAYNEATGNEKVLQIAYKLADYIDSYFGDEDGKHFGIDGHEEIEIGLMRLYRVSGNDRYKKLAEYFINSRGVKPGFFIEQWKELDNNLLGGVRSFPLTYFQNHVPVKEQDTAEGHAVRLVYMCTAMADIAAANNDIELYNACLKIWRNIVDKRMFITGGIGSTVIGESFTLDYDLPNDTMYCETCASVGLAFFARQMLRNKAHGEYADVMERAIYNTVIAGMALDGKHFFYVNPLEVNPESSKKDPTKSHVKFIRPEWLGCACCPPNLARLLMSVDKYIYHQDKDAFYFDLYIGSEVNANIAGSEMNIIQISDYVWDGNVEIKVNCKDKSSEKKTLAFRIPDWAEDYKVCIDMKELDTDIEDSYFKDGYLYVSRAWTENTVKITFDMTPVIWKANDKVKDDYGKVAISRGPFIYCLEGIDNGDNLQNVFVNPDVKFKYNYYPELLGGVGILECDGYRENTDNNKLYKKRNSVKSWAEEIKLKWIPYYAWANRGENEMTVWVRER